MEDFKVLKFLSKIEKLLNIHRDFTFLKLRKQILITLIILTDNIFFTLGFTDTYVYALNYKSEYFFRGTLSFQFMYLSQSVLVITYFGPRFSSEFGKLIASLSCVHEIIKHNLSYRKILSHLNVKCVVGVCVFIVIRVPAVVYGSVKQYYGDYHMLIMYISRFGAESRFLICVIHYCSILNILKSMLQAVTALIQDEATAGSLDKRLKTFVSAYQKIFESSRHLRKCFGHYVCT